MGRARRTSPHLLSGLDPRALGRFLVARDAPWAPKIFLLAAVVYAVMPVDLVPDLVPLVSWLDDLGVLGLALAWLGRSVSSYGVERKETDAQTIAAPELDRSSVEPGP